MPEAVNEGIGAAGDERIDEQEVGHERHFQTWIDPTRGGQDLELDGEDVLHRQAEDEDRDRDPEQRDDRDRAVGPALGMPGGQPPERDPEPDGEQERPEGQLDRRREAQRELLGDGPVVDDALAEIALGELAEVQEVLLVERLVEPELGEDCLLYTSPSPRD